MSREQMRYVNIRQLFQDGRVSYPEFLLVWKYKAWQGHNEEYDNVSDFKQRQEINRQGDLKFAFSSNFCQKARKPLKGLFGMSTQYCVDGVVFVCVCVCVCLCVHVTRSTYSQFGEHKCHIGGHMLVLPAESVATTINSIDWQPLQLPLSSSSPE